MGEPTLKDVLNAIAKLEANTKADLTRLEGAIAKVDAKVDAHRAETKKSFADLDDELSGHAKVHREIEKDIETLKRRPARTAARAPRRR